MYLFKNKYNIINKLISPDLKLKLGENIFSLINQNSLCLSLLRKKKKDLNQLNCSSSLLIEQVIHVFTEFIDSISSNKL